MSQFHENSRFQQKERESEQNLLEAKKLVYSSTKIGVETIESLRVQSEKLDETEQKLEDTDYLIAQSVRTLRGMTWSGAFYNVASDAASLFSGPSARSNSTSIKENSANHDISTFKTSSNTASSKGASSQSLFPTVPQETNNSKLDKDLDEISHALESLRAVGFNLNEQLGQQNEQLDRIETATDKLNDNTLAVTLRTSKVSNRTSHDSGKCIGSFQFISTENDMLLLGADGEYLVLTNSADTSTVFDVYLRYDTIVGLCNKRTGKFAGKTMWGGISIGGLYFGSMEEWYFDFSAEQSGLLCLSKNWGAGGWLKSPCAENLREDDLGVKRHILDTTSASVRDRHQCLNFRAISCGPPPEKTS